MKRKIIISVVIVLIILGLAGYFGFQYMISRPLYEPGMIRENASIDLAPPQQISGDNFWDMEKDIRLSYYHEGEGRNVLVIHGGPGFPIGKPLTGLSSLTDNYRFYYYDQRGCGKSSRPIDRFSSSNFYENTQTLEKTLGLSAQISDIERIRRLLGEEKVILIGHSFGAFIASLYAAEFPERVSAMILIAPANVLVFPQEEDTGLFEEIRNLLPEKMLAEYDDYLKRYFDFETIFDKSDDDLTKLNFELVKYYAAALNRKSVELPESHSLNNGGWMVQAMYFSMGMKHDYRPAIGKVTVPVLVLHGTNDLQSEEVSRIYADTFPNASFKTIANAGHFMFEDQPEQFSKLVSQFLAGTRQAN